MVAEDSKVAARTITIPESCLVLMIGASNSGKSTFAKRHFQPTEIVSSDHYRAVVSDDMLNMSSSADAFSLLRQVVDFRLKRGLLTVVDATNIDVSERKPLMEIARKHYVHTVAIVLDTPLSVSLKRAAERTHHPIPPAVVRSQHQNLKKAMRRLNKYVKAHVIQHDEVVQIERTPLSVNFKHLNGPFNIIGDIHGCYDELQSLMKKLPEGMPIFVGDLADRGPASPSVIRLVCDLVDSGTALWCPGNHDNKLFRYLNGGKVTISHGLQDTIDQIEAMPSDEREKLIADFVRVFRDLPSHYVLDGGKLLVAHAGLPENMHGRGVKGIYSTAMYGETTGNTDDEGLPERIDWAAEYRGRTFVVYGHSAYASERWLNNTVNIDTGCVFGGKLTAISYPSKEIVSVQAQKVYHPYGKPLPKPAGEYDDILDISDVTGRRQIHTHHDGVVKISDWKATAAFETLVTAGIDPRLMIYLPPTMSPCETSAENNYLEHPKEAIEYYANRGEQRVILEEKHMGSRAIALICRDEKAALARFGVKTLGTVYTRTGRPFFDGNEQLALVESLHADLTLANVWNEFETDWILLDGELMPWSAKAGSLLTRTYASTAMAGKHLSAAASAELSRAASRLDANPVLHDDLQRWNRMHGYMEKFRTAYLNYCWKVDSVSDLKYAPFALLATEGKTHFHLPNVQQMQMFAKWRGRIITPTSFVEVETNNPEQVEQAVQVWADMTSRGGEGMVVKPYSPITKHDNRLIQPGVKCRGQEYLRIIYGPDYTDNLDRLRRRNLNGKRSSAIKEFAMGVEGLSRFVVREPLRRVHECVFGVLAMESEPVDPRL